MGLLSMPTPGIGKTTLAWKIYQNNEIKSEFPTRIWVDIPHDFRSKDLCLNIIKKLINQGVVGFEDVRIQLNMPSVTCTKESYLDILDAFAESGRISDRQLIDAVRACLEKRKFLLVVDDVWTADALRIVMDLLPNRGKLLITSCNTSFCIHANVKRKPHVMGFRNDEESWQILEREVFGKLGVCPETLKSTGRVIARDCDGLPLAIVAVGARLRVASSAEAPKYLNEQWWKKVSENVMVYVKDYDHQRTFKSIELKYMNLTQQMQDCFLYLGVFPQGDEIPVWTLTRLWIAERLVQDGEETAEQTLSHLVDRNLVMVVRKSNSNGQIKTCRLHKLMYGFCKYKAAEQEFYHEIKMSGGGAIDGLISLAPYHRRLCINNSHLSEFLSTTPKERQVRSLLCLNKEEKVVLHPRDISTIHISFELLKIFECKGVKFTKFPTMLSKLMNLRYISLSCDDGLEAASGAAEPDSLASIQAASRATEPDSLASNQAASRATEPDSLTSNQAASRATEPDSLPSNQEASREPDSLASNQQARAPFVIPESVSSLCYLETLVVHTRSASIKLKAYIHRMLKLRHLVTKAAIVVAAQGKGGAGKDLHTLTRLAPVSCRKDVFNTTPNLNKLGIRGDLAALSDADSLKILEHLGNLKLMNEPAKEIQLDLHCFPPTLKRLTLSGTYLKWESIYTLGYIGSLEILKLKNYAFIGESWTSEQDAAGFGGLRFLLIGTTNLKLWEASDDCFPSLKHLVLNNCENLQHIPSTLAKNIDKVDIEGTAEFARKINQKIAEAKTESNE